jgi:methionyl-tRNA formyltransferase
LTDVGVVPARVLWQWRESGHEIAEVWTSAASRRGAWKRDRRLGWFAPRWSLTAAIVKWNLRHRVVENLRSASQISDQIESLAVDVIVSVHFMRILPAELLSRLSMPVLNLHPALLPAYRGPTPLISMILDETQDRYGGVTLHRIVPAVDAGPVYASRAVPFPASGNLRRWELELARAAAHLAVEAIPEVVAGRMPAIEQTETDARYRRATASDLQLTSAQRARRIAWLCSTLGPVRPLLTTVDVRDYAISHFSRQLGPPSGRPARIGCWTIEMDVADARVRLRRKPWWEGRRRRIETWLIRVFSPT